MAGIIALIYSISFLLIAITEMGHKGSIFFISLVIISLLIEKILDKFKEK